jgi:glutathione S-transferase
MGRRPDGCASETLVTVTFSERKGEHGPETEVQLLHSGFPATDVRDAHDAGWQGCMNKLADFTDTRGTAASLALIGTPRSTYVRTVRMALVENGSCLRVRSGSAAYAAGGRHQSYGRIPVFRDGATALFETSAIVRYLDETFEGAPLLAPNARLRGQMEQWVSMINCHGYDAMVRRYVLHYVFRRVKAGRRTAGRSMRRFPRSSSCS